MEFSDREHWFKSTYGENPEPYSGESDARIAYREILRLKKQIDNMRDRERWKI